MKLKFLILIFFQSMTAFASNNYVAECDKFGMRDSLSCYNYVDCRNNGSDIGKCTGGRFPNEVNQNKNVTPSKNKKNVAQAKDYLSDDGVSISDKLKDDAIAQERRRKEWQEADKKRTEELTRQQAIQQQRCAGPYPQPGCPNYQPRYDKNGKIIY